MGPVRATTRSVRATVGPAAGSIHPTVGSATRPVHPAVGTTTGSLRPTVGTGVSRGPRPVRPTGPVPATARWHAAPTAAGQEQQTVVDLAGFGGGVGGCGAVGDRFRRARVLPRG